ncbi:TfuA domain-containing protein [Microvirga terrae]|uniref:TfuA domain-containing protein n=1 Tax=Microvirga terrae TaxID=2740529 RepID=A0ABY5RNJ9_9HYPH|nr:TfuA domain-containing protein [Microvirga terrae]UVF18821.1 TfuA domain-containing protein [Microvirga terrae]
MFHKEILWALKQGIHVFGAASMGALRAAELHRFGMVGIGEVFEAYRDGRLQRDDAVALLHGPAELGWPQLTRSLVDIHATLAAAESSDIIEPDDTQALAQSAATLFWRERTYAAVVGQALADDWRGERSDAFLAWVEHHEVFQKERDCLALLEHVSMNWQALEEPFQPEFRFEHTEAWQVLQAEVEQAEPLASEPGILAALQQHSAHEAIEAQALLSLLAEEFLREADGPDDPLAFSKAAAVFRSRHGLTSADNVARWMTETGLSHADYTALVRNTGNIDVLQCRFAPRLSATMLRIARARGLLDPAEGLSTQNGEANRSAQR